MRALVLEREAREERDRKTCMWKLDGNMAGAVGEMRYGKAREIFLKEKEGEGWAVS